MKGFYRFGYILLYPFFRIFYKISVKGREYIPEGAALICANHSAYSDPLILAFAFGLKHFMRFLAKIELMRIPVFGYLLKLAGVIGVNRGKSDVSAIKTALKTLKSGVKVAIFPEGTRVAESDAAAAKTGAILLASKTGVPIVPVYIPRNKKFFSTLDVVIGEPYLIERLKGGGSEVYTVYASELMEKIEALKP
jgi:1-acyl-sn-glycerol-3-phosphate acyltransferase